RPAAGRHQLRAPPLHLRRRRRHALPHQPRRAPAVRAARARPHPHRRRGARGRRRRHPVHPRRRAAQLRGDRRTVRVHLRGARQARPGDVGPAVKTGHDLTQGAIAGHLIRMAIPMALGMIFQTLYVLVDLYFVAQLGDTAIAGVSAAGNVQFIVLALTQVLGVGTTVLIAHAAGRKDRVEGARAFRQSLVLSGITGLAVLLLGGTLAPLYLRSVAADAETVRNGMTYLAWFLPALAMQFALISMGAALRGAGVAKPTMLIQMATVALNAVLAPVLIAGWGTGRPMGIAGAGLASSIAV